MSIRPVSKCHGGKFPIYKWQIGLFPKDYHALHFYDTYAGGGSITLNKAPSLTETICEKNDGLWSIYKWLTTEPKRFFDLIKQVPYSVKSFTQALAARGDPYSVEGAVAELIVRRMSRGGLGKEFSESARDRGGRMGDENAWLTFLRWDLALIANRLRYVEVSFDLAVPTLKRTVDLRDVLWYLDPPYLHATRVAKDAYNEDEMSTADHRELLELCLCARGKVFLCGYRSSLYDTMLKNWNRHELQVANHSGQNAIKQKRVECVWLNY